MGYVVSDRYDFQQFKRPHAPGVFPPCTNHPLAGTYTLKVVEKDHTAGTTDVRESGPYCEECDARTN